MLSDTRKTVDLETIREESETKSGKQPVDTLLIRHWCAEEDLLSAASALSADSEIDNAVVFFQLPHAIRFKPQWIPIPAKRGHPYAFFRTLSNESDPRTQVLISFELWLPWQSLYRSYLARIGVEPKKSLSHERIKIRDTPTLLTPAVYEAELAGSLRRHAAQLFNRNILPSYRVVCRDPYAQAQKVLQCFFVMYKSGRIVLLGDNPNTPNSGRQARQPTDSTLLSGSEFKKWFRTRKEPSVYEEYILDGLRQVDLGFPELAVVQTVICLEWFANEVISQRLSSRASQIEERFSRLIFDNLWGKDGRLQRGGYVTTWDKFRRYLPALGVSLSISILQEVGALFDVRDDVVHHLHKVKVDDERGRWAVNVGLKTIAEAMTLIASNPK